MMWGYGWGSSGVDLVFMVLLWSLIGTGIFWLVRGGFATRDERHDSTRRILDERFATGEITAEDYGSCRRVLR
jgi:uncharacterized membrane protein